MKDQNCHIPEFVRERLNKTAATAGVPQEDVVKAAVAWFSRIPQNERTVLITEYHYRGLGYAATPKPPRRRWRPLARGCCVVITAIRAVVRGCVRLASFLGR